MSDLLDHIDQSIRTRRLLRPGQAILVAVSGGVDSMVLLDLLHELAPAHRWQLTIAHFNHHLRGRSSDADERLVRRVAKRLKLPLLTGGADVRAFARAGKLSLEMAARRLRHDFLAQAAAQRRIPTVALAHHADDQLELFFLRLLRGSGGEGLAGAKWRNPSPSDPALQLVRPLLDQPKSALLEYAAANRIPYREDATNAALDFQRNRIRHELLPLLRKSYQPALDRTIARVMEITGAEAEFAAEAAREWLGQLRPSPGAAMSAVGCASALPGASAASYLAAPGDGRTPGARRGRSNRGTPFDQLPVAVQRRGVQLQLLGLGVLPHFDLVEQLRTAAEVPVAVSAPEAGRVCCCAPRPRTGAHGVRALPSAPLCAVRDRLGAVRLQAAQADGFKSSALDIPLKGQAGQVEFGGASISWRIQASKALSLPRAAAGRESFDADKVGPRVRLRHWQPGDRYQPIGMAEQVKLQDCFINQKVPRERRRLLLVATTAGGEVFWVEGMRISERFKLTKGTIHRLQWCWKRR